MNISIRCSVCREWFRPSEKAIRSGQWRTCEACTAKAAQEPATPDAGVLSDG